MINTRFLGFLRPGFGEWLMKLSGHRGRDVGSRRFVSSRPRGGAEEACWRSK
jgi:hypothetical protein